MVPFLNNSFEKSIMIDGGIHFNGLSDLYLLEGVMNEFCYAQSLLFYEENIEELKK